MSTGPAALIPDIRSQALALVRDSVHSQHSKRAYEAAVISFLAWYERQGAPGLTKATVQQYRAELEISGLSPSTINVRIAAIRKLAAELADNRLLDAAYAAAIAKVGGIPILGTRTGNWLTASEAETLLALPNCHTIKGLRDRALLAVLIGAGLRRSEASNLQVEYVQQREGRWVLADLTGKHNRIRTVPIPSWCKVAIDVWMTTGSVTSGTVFRPVNEAGHVGPGLLSAQAIRHIVRSYGTRLGMRLAPHDMRRTFARLAHTGRASLDQIRLSLGHSSLTTTEAYLGVRQDLADAPCDHLGIRSDWLDLGIAIPEPLLPGAVPTPKLI